MNPIEERLLDLEEYLMRNDGRVDHSAYMTIVGIANDVSELEDKNAKLQELVSDVYEALRADKIGMFHKLILASMEDNMRELGIKVE